jgi:class 3 adenylate cyclase
MFADMVDCSRRMEQDETQNAEQAARAIELFKSLIGDYGGQVANVAGDGILALFDSAGQALSFGLQIQSEFRDQAVWVGGEPIEFRIGLNLGEVMVDKGYVQGHCVNVAARLQAMAERGGILVTEGIRAALRDTSEVPLRSLGPQTLKNISGSIEVFAVDQLGTEAPRPIVYKAPPPEPPVPFFPRFEDVAERGARSGA